jgi:hypothetical protein
VCVVERRRDRANDREHVLQRSVLSLVRKIREQSAQILAVDVLHREEVRAEVLADIVDLHDVVVMEGACEARLGEKHLDESVVVGLRRPQVLDDDVVLEPFDTVRARDREIGHATASEMLHDLVSPQLAAGGDAVGGSHLRPVSRHLTMVTAFC